MPLALVENTSTLQTPWQWAVAILSIVFIDIILAGDNAVLIALAVRQLPPQKRWIGIAAGAGAAVVLRIGLTFAAMKLLSLPWLKLGGGLLILWIAIKLLRDNTGDEDEQKKSATNIWQAVVLIVIADLTMSLDNVLAVAGASQGNVSLLIFGLVLSIPLVVFASNFLARLMDRYPATIYVGSAILGWVAGGMLMTDQWVTRQLHPGAWTIRAVEVLCAVAVLLTPLLRRKSADTSAAPH